MDPLTVLGEIIAQRHKVSAAQYAGRPAFDLLRVKGFLIGAGTVQSLPCLLCDTPHDADVIHQQGSKGHNCPDLGFVPLTADEIAAVKPDLEKLIFALAEALDLRGRKSSPISGETWRIGRMATNGGDIAIYFHPRMIDSQDAANVASALANEPGATYRLILSGAGVLLLPKARCVQLDDAFALNIEGTQLKPIADLRDFVGAPRTNPGGAPNRYGDALTAIITRRITNGLAKTGRNAEADAVLADFKAENPGKPSPSLSSTREYVSKVRAKQ